MKPSLLLLLVAALVWGHPMLYLLDCGPHGKQMYDTVLDEGYPPSSIVRYTVGLSEPPECVNHSSLDNAFATILRNLTLPARVSMSLGYTNLTYVSLPLIWLLDAGAMVWAAAGNDGTTGCDWPAIQNGVYAVRHPSGNTCANKNQTQVITVSGTCSSSVATARTAARGMTANYSLPNQSCDSYYWPWYYLAATLIVLYIIVFCVGMCVLFFN